MSTTIVCPSGLSVAIRGMKGKELKILSDRVSLRNGTFLDKILKACVESVIDSGPYDLGLHDSDKDAALNWDKVLVGDRLYVAIQIRIATFGETFSFKAGCGTCGSKGDYDAELTALTVQNLSEEDRTSYRNGESLTAKLPGTDQAVAFRLATGVDEKRLINPTAIDKASNEDPVLRMLARRIESIEGVADIKKFLSDAELGTITKLLKELNKRDCGVDTSLELSCPNCGTNQEVSVPIGSANFWLPV